MSVAVLKNRKSHPYTAHEEPRLRPIVLGVIIAHGLGVIVLCAAFLIPWNRKPREEIFAVKLASLPPVPTASNSNPAATTPEEARPVEPTPVAPIPVQPPPVQPPTPRHQEPAVVTPPPAPAPSRRTTTPDPTPPEPQRRYRTPEEIRRDMQSNTRRVERQRQTRPTPSPVPSTPDRVTPERVQPDLSSLRNNLQSSVNDPISIHTPDAVSPASADYASVLSSYLYNAWQQPSRSEVADRGAYVTVELTIQPDGRVSSRRVLRTSGISALDRSAQNLLKALDRVPALPPALNDRPLTQAVRLQLR